MYLIYFIISIIIFINRCLLNEDYQEIFNTGYFYSLFCKDIEYKLFNKTFNGLINPNTNILDFGCGPGIISDFFTNYTGIDIDENRINYAKQLYPNKTFILLAPQRKNEDSKNLNFWSILQNDNEDIIQYNLPFRNNFFETILFNDCLHHISNYEISNILPELNRILKENGTIIIREPKKNTNFFTYFITELFENGDYVRTTNEYKQIFSSFDIIYEKSENIFIRDYYVLIVKKNNNILFNDKSNKIKLDRPIMNIITYVLFIYYFL